MIKNISEENKICYEKAVNRLKNIGITDPTNIIAELEKEIDTYRERVKNAETECRKQAKEKEIEDILGNINFNNAIITKEDSDYIYIESEYGTAKYSKYKLAIFWLQHSNDCFYRTFGFSWVPDKYWETKARAFINSCNKKNESIAERIAIGVDLAKGIDISINQNFLEAISGGLNSYENGKR